MEGKLADTAPKRPLALTIGAAAATLVVILGVLAGPAFISCFNSEDGLGICLRGKMAEVGLAPPLPAPAVAEAPAAEPEPEVSAANADMAVSEEPELDVTPPVETADAEIADTVIAATFGLLRAEPDGSIVIAGSGTPGSNVQIFANGELIGTVEVEASGDWVFVPDAPLEPGDLEITLGEEGKSGTAEQSFIVVLNEDRTTQPLVVASVPGEASEVLQGLAPPAAAPAIAATAEPEPDAEPASPQIAAVEPPMAEDEPATAEEAPAAPAEPAEASADAPASVAAPAEMASADAGTASTDEPSLSVADLPETAEAEVEPLSSAPVAPVEAEAEPALDAASAPEPANPVADTAPAATPESPAQVAPATEPTQLADVQPTIDAIELDGDRTFFAGSGPDERIVRLYVDNGFVADAPVDDGRWLVEAGPVLEKPSQRVRIDVIQPESGAVVARSEVDFVVDLPASAEDQITVADAEPAPASEPAAPLDAPATPAEPVTAPAMPAAPDAEPAPAPETASAPEQSAATAEPATPEAAEPAVPTMVAVSLGDPESQRFASGKAIIRRGDNLWTIARRVYGEGVKYTAIYEANTGSIRDPDRIYPGQVFELPTE